MSVGEQIKKQFRASDLPAVQVEAFGQQLYVRHWSGRDRANWQALVFEQRDGGSSTRFEYWWAATVALSLVDEAGAYVFAPTGTDAHGRPLHTTADIEDVAELDAPILEEAYREVNKVVQVERDRVAEAAKNSVNGQSSASPAA